MHESVSEKESYPAFLLPADGKSCCPTHIHHKIHLFHSLPRMNRQCTYEHIHLRRKFKWSDMCIKAKQNIFNTASSYTQNGLFFSWKFFHNQHLIATKTTPTIPQIPINLYKIRLQHQTYKPTVWVSPSVWVKLGRVVLCDHQVRQVLAHQWCTHHSAPENSLPPADSCYWCRSCSRKKLCYYAVN